MSFIINPYAFTTGGGGEFGPGPDTIDDLELWLDAFQLSGLSEDQIVSPWPDVSGNGRNGTHVRVGTASPEGATYKGTSGPNSKPAVRMVAGGGGSTNGGHYTLANFMTGFSAGHVIEVIKMDSDPPSGFSQCSGAGDWDNTTDLSLYNFGDNNIYDSFGSTVRKTVGNPTPSLTSWQVYERRSVSGAWSAWLTGASLFSTGTNTVGWSTTPHVGFAGHASGIYCQGLLAELIFYSRVLNSGEITTLYTYLETKYGFTLP